MQKTKTKAEINLILSRAKITQTEVSKLVSLTLDSEPVIEMKKRMQLLIGEGLELLNKLPKKKPLGKFQAIVSFMLEDL